MPDPREYLEDGRRAQQLGTLERALECYQRAADTAEDVAVAAEACRRLSSVYRAQCRWEDALEAAHRSAAHARRAGDEDAVAEAFNAEAAVFMSRGEFRVAKPILEEAVECARSDRTVGISLQNLGHVTARTGELEAAERHLESAALHFRRAGYRWGEACVLTSLAGIALDQERFALADSLAVRAIEVTREIGDLNLLALATKNRAEALARLGELAKAEQLASEALGHFGTTGDTMRQVETYKLLGEICERHGDATSAQSCFAKGLELARRIEARGAASDLSERLGAISEASPFGPPKRAREG